MTKRFKPLAFIILATALLVGWVGGVAADDFYKGKTIRFLVGFSAGGGFDTYSRAIARHFSKHVPGNPNIIVQNMPGAGSMISAIYLYNKAKPDGLTIGNFIGPLMLQHVMGNKVARYDGRKFGWLGAPAPDKTACAVTKASGIKNMEDWLARGEPLKIGATGPGSTTADTPKLIRAATGLPVNVVEGYGGTSRIRLAAEGGEVQGACWGWPSMKVTWRKALESGEVRVVLQGAIEPHPDLKNVPRAIQFAKGETERELLTILDALHGDTARPYAAPPGVPPDRLRLLREAFVKTLKDPDFLAEANKARLEIDPVSGEALTKKFAGLYDLKPDVVARLRDILVPKK